MVVETAVMVEMEAAPKVEKKVVVKFSLEHDFKKKIRENFKKN